MASRPLSLHLELVLWVFLAWKFQWMGRGRGIWFPSVMIFLALFLCVLPNYSLSSLIWSICISSPSPWVWLESVLSQSHSFLIIIQKQETEREGGREKERLRECNHLRKQISHDSIFCLFQIGLELFYSSEMPKDKWGFLEMNVKFAYLQTGLCLGGEGTHFPPTHYTIICCFIWVLSNELLIDDNGLVWKGWVLEWGRYLCSSWRYLCSSNLRASFYRWKNKAWVMWFRSHQLWSGIVIAETQSLFHLILLCWWTEIKINGI